MSICGQRLSGWLSQRGHDFMDFAVAELGQDRSGQRFSVQRDLHGPAFDPLGVADRMLYVAPPRPPDPRFLQALGRQGSTRSPS